MPGAYDSAADMTSAVGTAGTLLKGAGEQQVGQEDIKAKEAASGLAFVKDASGNMIDLFGKLQQQKANVQRMQLMQEGAAARQQTEIAAKQQEEATKAQNEKAKADYENFVTVTPELADGLFKSTKGRLDFRPMVGQRIMTKVLLPLAQIYGREVSAEDKGDKKVDNSDEKADEKFVAIYDKKKKDYNDPLQVSMAARDPKLKAQRDADAAWLQKNEAAYNGAISGIKKHGKLKDNQQSDKGTVTPPAINQSDADSILDAAKIGQ